MTLHQPAIGSSPTSTLRAQPCRQRVVEQWLPPPSSLHPLVEFGGRQFSYHDGFDARLALVLTDPGDREAWRDRYSEGVGIEFLVLWDDLPDVGNGRRRFMADALPPFPVPGVVWFDASLNGDLIKIRSVGYEGLE